MPLRTNVKRKLTKYGYIQDIRKSNEKCDWWTDCVGNGRDIRYDWDSSGWVGQFSILANDGACRWESLSDITLDELFNGFKGRGGLTLTEKLDREGDLAHTIIKAIKLSREGR